MDRNEVIHCKPKKNFKNFKTLFLNNIPSIYSPLLPMGHRVCTWIIWLAWWTSQFRTPFRSQVWIFLGLRCTLGPGRCSYRGWFSHSVSCARNVCSYGLRYINNGGAQGLKAKSVGCLGVARIGKGTAVRLNMKTWLKQRRGGSRGLAPITPLVYNLRSDVKLTS